MKSIFSRVIYSLLIVTFITACETDDVLASLVELEASQNSLSEADGSVVVTAALNAPAASDVTVSYIISGSATRRTDYTVSADEIVISKGATSGEVTINAVQDNDLEEVETIEFTITAVQNANLVGEYTASISILDDDADTDNDGVVDALDDCVNTPGEVNNNGCPFLGFIINEVLYDPPSDLPGDANGDGSRSASDDEFVEFFNSGEALDISGYEVFDEDNFISGDPKHVFPAGTIVPRNGVLVLFGGGTPTGNFGGAIVQTANGADGNLNLNNGGDMLILTDTSGATVVSFDINPLSGNPDESYTRNPDLTGDFEQHARIDAAEGRLFSPGTKLNGTSF
ncbi:lamin tail domain-containing protein [Nonlabens agnitus]|uniref:Endonuclease n=1 Tax=Nonlabens agnitus TaxID=870484 RepID=A0A2S9WS07_9FLAO|nr:lamin tail domain-containing protein [Nonlabens agnitus]PRP66239.1 endonuclease [Nonlabens agnitus]